MTFIRLAQRRLMVVTRALSQSMTLRSVISICLAIIVLAAPVRALLGQAAQSAQALFQQALTLERAQGKLDSAITLYRRVVATAGTNRALAARALIQMGSAYEVLGKTEARAAYDRVVREFSDQRDLASTARARITALGGAGNSATVAPLAHEVWAGMRQKYSPPSPDRQWVTYLDMTTGNLAVHSLVTGRNRLLPTGGVLRTAEGTRDPTAAYADPETVFSQDSKRIAYTWHTDAVYGYELRTIGVDGSGLRAVPTPKMTYFQSFAWTPAGDAVLGLIFDATGDEYLGFVRMTGQIQRVVAYTAKAWSFSLSPDGRWIVFDALVGTEQQRDILIVAADGSRAGVLVRNAANDWHPMWTPDGRSVVFYSDRGSGWRAWQVDVADGAARGVPRALSSDMGSTQPIGFTKDGAFWYSPIARALVLESARIDSATGRLLEEPSEVPVPALGRSVTPDWSPDGRSIAFISRRSDAGDRPNAIVIQSHDGTDRREIVLSAGYVLMPRWSPDGRSILLVVGGSEGGQSAGLFRLDVATGGVAPVRVWRGPAVSPPLAEWSSDGRAIYYAFYSDSAGAVLHRYDLANTRDTVLYRNGAATGMSTLAASPDGQWIAFTMTGGAGPLRTLLLATSSGAVKDLQPARPFFRPNWMADSRSLIARVARSGQSQDSAGFWRIPIDGTAPERLDFRRSAISYLRVDRTGHRVAFTAAPVSPIGGQLWVMENLLRKSP